MPFKINLNDELGGPTWRHFESNVDVHQYIRLSLSLFLTFPTHLLLFPSSFTEFIHSSVRYIEMSNTHLQSVDDETFQGLRLKTLKLIDNELQDISERSFR